MSGAGDPRLLARPRARARPRPPRLEAGPRARRRRRRAARPDHGVAPHATTTLSPTRRTRSSSATSGPRSSGTSSGPAGATPSSRSARRPLRRDRRRRTSSTGAWPRPTSSSSSGSTATRPETAPPALRSAGAVAGSMARRARARREPLGQRAAREPRVQGDRGARARAPAAPDRLPARRGRLRDRLRRGGRRRPLPAGRREPREGDRRAGGLPERLRRAT